MVGHIQFHHMGVTAIGLDAGTQILEPLHTSAGQHHSSTGLGQRPGKLGAQPAGRAGDEGHPAG